MAKITMTNRGFDAAIAYTERQGWGLISDHRKDGYFYAYDGKERVMVVVRTSRKPGPLTLGDRAEKKYQREARLVARIDLISILVFDEDDAKALLRHHRGAVPLR
jgi:hypothetical protein